MSPSVRVDDATTIPELFFAQVAAMPDHEALRWKVGKDWISMTYGEWGEHVRLLAAAMADWVGPGDTVCMIAENRKEWTFVDLAVQGLGGIVAPIYPTSPPKDVAYIINDAGATAVVVSTAYHLERLMALKAAGEIDKVERFVVMDDLGELPDGVLQLSDLIAQGGDESVMVERSAKLEPNQMATLIYTSGTTGMPKGVMLSHRNFISNVHAGANRVGQERFVEPVFLSFLPLSHSLERTCGYYMAIRVGGCIAYAESIDKLVDNFSEVHPSIVISVPRIYEKVYAKVMAKGAAGGIKTAIFNWSLGIGQAKAHAEAERQPVPFMVKLLYPIAYKAVFSKLHETLGGNVQFTVSGGAPLAKEIAIFLKAAGLTVLEGYGLTETAPILTINGPEWTRFGAVGQALEDIELKIDPEPGAERPDEGEILAKGPNIMLGYYNKPDATAEVMTEDGFFRTGDIGYIDSDGFVFITDRKKELLKTSGGKYVAPSPIENTLKLSPVIEQACVIGNKRKFCTALVFPDVAALESKLGKKLPQDTAALSEMPEVREIMQKAMDEANRGLGKWEMIKYFAILPRPLTVEDGELTPTLKMKRRKIDEHFKDLIDSMY